MSKITLEVNDNHLSDVLTVLKSLKTGMVTKIDVEGKTKPENSLGEKYINKQTYKEKYKLPNTNETKTSRYLSPAQFKQKLKEKQ